MSGSQNTLSYCDFTPVFIDCQTSGGSADTDRIIEFAWGAIGRGGRLRIRSVHARLARGESLRPQVARLTGITDDDLEDALTQKDLFDLIRSVIDQHTKVLARPLVFVAHFKSFEGRFLDALWQRHGRRRGCPVPMLCTHALARALVPGLTSYSLRAVAGHLHAPVDELKRAEAHVAATFAVWQRLVPLLGDGCIDRAMLEGALSSRTRRSSGKDNNFLIEPATRLGLPETPGVYYFLGRDRRVLYVGKAKNLRARVNGHFTGRRQQSARKREMLVQIKDIDWLACETELEAILREHVDIGRLDPPYNQIHRSEYREFCLARDLLPIDSAIAAAEGIGYFKDGTALAYWDEVLSSMATNEPLAVGGIIPSKRSWRQGCNDFIAEIGIRRKALSDRRRVMAVVLWWQRRMKPKMRKPEEVPVDESTELAAKSPSADEVRAWLERFFAAAAREYRLGRLTRRLEEAHIVLSRGSKSKLRIEISKAGGLGIAGEPNEPRVIVPAKDLDYRRQAALIRLLAQEVRKAQFYFIRRIGGRA